MAGTFSQIYMKRLLSSYWTYSSYKFGASIALWILTGIAIYGALDFAFGIGENYIDPLFGRKDYFFGNGTKYGVPPKL